MSAALQPYGGDKDFQRADRHTVLGGNLRAFLPEDRFDEQPVALPEGQGWLVAEVRLDNRAELAGLLGLPAPEQLADSAILAAAWARWGEACLSRLLGVFAFAVWNPARRELFLARDHIGERPLFFHRGHDFFAFSSMPKGLLALPGVHQGIDENTLINLLVLAKNDFSASFFKGIERVPPGHFVRATPGKVHVEAYWRPFGGPPVRFKRDEDYAEAFLEIFDQAVKARLRSTGKVGSQLSSGLDSTSVTASAARLLAERGEGMTSFTAVPRRLFGGHSMHGRLPDEGEGAASVARLYPNIEHVRLDSEGVSMVPAISQLSDAVDEPVMNCVNGMWNGRLLDEARARGISTVLVGVRGNLTFSHTGKEALPMLFRHGRWLELARSMHSFRQKGLVSLRESVGLVSTGLVPDRLHHWLHRVHTFDISYSAVNAELAEGRGVRDNMLRQFYPNRYSLQDDRLLLFQTYDMDTFCAGYQAVHGVDMRDPCADRRVVDFCFGIPVDQYIADGVPRSLVRRAMRGRLPDSILMQRRRGQQGADWYLSVQDAMPDLRREILLNDTSPMARRLLDQPRMHALLERWKTFDEEARSSWPMLGEAFCRCFSFGYFIRKHEPRATAD